MKHSAFTTAFISALIISVCIFSGMIAFRQDSHQAGCSLDGSEIQPLYEVVIIQNDRLSKSFACVVSAHIWFSENMEQISSVLVTDEATGKKIRAEDAFYVVSEVVTTPYAGNRIHVFAEKTKAGAHAELFKGKLVKNPFLPEKRKPTLLVKHKTDPRSDYGFFFPDSRTPLSLPAKIVLMNKQDCACLPQGHPVVLLEGYFNPPDKPPRIPV